jgi:tetratricopeptide (TPR) repeat protein
MPLSIELAAARVGALTPRDILARLNDRYKLLQTRASHLPERQRALTGAVEWSVDLLAEADRDLFARLSVFSGGFTIDAAEAVCDDGSGDIDVLEGVHELRRHSLLRGETEAGAQRVRFSFLTFLREYAARLLASDGGQAAADLRARHARFYLDYAEERAGGVRTEREPAALADLARELDNVRAALDYAAGAGDGVLLARLTLAAEPALHRRGYWAELEGWLNDAIAAADRLPDDAPEAPRLRAVLRARLAALDHDQGDSAPSAANARDALARFEALGDDAGRAEMRNLLGLLALADKDFEAAADHFEGSLALRHPDDHAGCSLPMYNLAWLASLTGDQDGARRRYEESLERQRQAGDRRLQARTLGNLGAVAYRCGDYAEADRLYRESLALHRELGDTEGIATTLYNLAELAEEAGDAPRAVMLLVHAERLFREIGSALAGAPGEALARLSEKMGDGPFRAAKEMAVCSEWEALC